MVALPIRRVRRKEPTRQRFELTDQEQAALARLSGRSFYADAKLVWDFWKSVAAVRGLDYETIIGSTSDPVKFTALPFGHGKHWCWPSPLNLTPPRPLDNAAFAQAVH